MVQFDSLSAVAQNNAASFLEGKVGYKLVGNPYVEDVAKEVMEYLDTASKLFYFDERGNFICAQPKEW